MNKIARMCFNWKVLTALAFLGLGVWIAAPGLLGAALPVLVVAVCPLSMLVMMRRMQGDRSATSAPEEGRPADLPATQAEQLAELRSQLATIRARQESVSKEISQLEQGPIQESEPVRAADRIERSKLNGSG